MIWFVAILLALISLALVWVLVPLLRRNPLAGGIARSSSNLVILRDQLAELEKDFKNGSISSEQHAKAREELERRVLEEAAVETQAAQSAPRRGRWTAIALGILIPIFSILLYLQLGNLDGLSPPRTSSAEHQITPEQLEAMVARLAARLEKSPDDAQGWAMLARSYYVMQRLPEAIKAYAKVTELVKDDAELYADYADVQAMAQGKRIDGKALELVNQALKIDPNHPKALALAGSAAFQRKDYKGALAYWEKLQQQVPPGSEFGTAVAANIAEARELGGLKAESKAPQPATTGASAISGKVVLSPSLAAKASPQDTVFVLARAVSGPRAPLAVMRRQVKDLPLDFTLDDTMAMAPETKMSGFSEVVVTARVSKAGGVAPQSGDLQGTSPAIKVGTRGVSLVIDSVVP